MISVPHFIAQGFLSTHSHGQFTPFPRKDFTFTLIASIHQTLRVQTNLGGLCPKHTRESKPSFLPFLNFGAPSNIHSNKFPICDHVFGPSASSVQQVPVFSGANWANLTRGQFLFNKGPFQSPPNYLVSSTGTRRA